MKLYMKLKHSFIIGLPLLLLGIIITVLLGVRFNTNQTGYIFLTVFIFCLPGVFLFVYPLQSSYTKNVGQVLDQNLQELNPYTYITTMYTIIKVKSLYVVKYNDRFLNIIKVEEHSIFNPTSFRKIFIGVKLVSSFPIFGKVCGNYQRFKIRRSDGTTKLYDPELKHWIQGEASQFSIALPKNNSLKFLYDPDLWKLIEYVETL